jgi:hypothetical protein
MTFRSPPHLRLPIVAATLALVACGDLAAPVAPAGTATEQPLLARAPSRPTGTGIGVIGSKIDRVHQRVEYHGGSMMYGITSLYLIWYGNWAGSTTPSILTDLVENVGGSSYFGAVTRYANTYGVAPNNAVIYSGSVDDSYSYGAYLYWYDVGSIVGQAIIGGSLPLDPDAVYVVLPSADVEERSGFGVDYCGFHGQTNVNGVPVQVMFVGNPDRAPSQCMPQSVGPNGNAGADAMATILVNELFDTIVDPHFDAWYDRFGLEPADKCAWNFGTTYTTTNGARANVRLGSRDYLLQQLWVPDARGYCTLGATVTP